MDSSAEMSNFNFKLSDTTGAVDPYKAEREGKTREVGSQATWSLSSCKPGTYSIYFYSSALPAIGVLLSSSSVCLHFISGYLFRNK